MQNQRAHTTISAAAATLFVFLGATALFLPPLNHYISGSMMLMALAGMAIGVSIILHFIFVGIAAWRLGRNTALWVTLSVLFFPIASIIGLILFEWFSEEQHEPPVTTS